MPAATAAQIHTALSALLKIADETTMASYWNSICAAAATFAQQEVQGRLYRRGLAMADIANFDRLYEVTLDLGLWKSVMMGGLYAQFDPSAMKALDRREDLDTMLLFVNGVWTQPHVGPHLASTGPLMQGYGQFTYNPDGDDVDQGIPW
jgi:hypothetical protein